MDAIFGSPTYLVDFAVSPLTSYITHPSLPECARPITSVPLNHCSISSLTPSSSYYAPFSGSQPLFAHIDLPQSLVIMHSP